MSHGLYRLLDLLDQARLPYRLDRHRCDTVLITVTVVGERIEIDVFEDGHVEFARFAGNEAVADDLSALEALLRRHSDSGNS
ncbi:MAG: hypothetical protein J0H01_17080 [Rhizobiales bacterium]|nr:hypothetical protein [Hyphomicrobiales bacterium]